MRNETILSYHGGDIYSKRELKYASRIIDFSANINPLGMPQEVKTAIIENIDTYECYPDPLCRELTSAIATMEQTEVKNILCGNGAADIIYRLVLGLKPKKALLLAPTFSEYEQALKTVGCSVNYFNLSEKTGFALDEIILDEITEELDILFICNPNNPTGVATKRELMLKIANKCKACFVTLVVDECFIDFLIDEEEYSISSEISRYDNLVIIKAFTKIYAMAGIRLGYLLCSNQETISATSEASQSWSVSTVASKCGVCALAQRGYVKKTKELIENNRRYLIENLKLLGFHTYDAKANYILFYTSHFQLDKKLEPYGILIRDCQNYHNLEQGYFRIAVKSDADNHYFIDCIKKVITE
ncbi:MAG: histidinol-phosphate transaminase [Oscillospiraceae bacterium]